MPNPPPLPQPECVKYPNSYDYHLWTRWEVIKTYKPALSDDVAMVQKRICQNCGLTDLRTTRS